MHDGRVTNIVPSHTAPREEVQLILQNGYASKQTVILIADWKLNATYFTGGSIIEHQFQRFSAAFLVKNIMWKNFKNAYNVAGIFQSGTSDVDCCV